jgi:hypothetical protein
VVATTKRKKENFISLLASQLFESISYPCYLIHYTHNAFYNTTILSPNNITTKQQYKTKIKNKK